MQHTSTILIVDDQPPILEVLRGLLVDQGYHLAFAGSGGEALAKATELTPDLILLDVMMPDMDGFEVCEHLRADSHLAEVPVIMITALDDPESRLRGIKSGADDFVTKPFNGTEIQARVRTITRLNRYRRLLLERTYRQQAEEEIHRRNRELLLLNRFITAAASTLNVHDTLYVACETLAYALDLSQASAVLLNEDKTEFTLVVDYLAPGVGLRQAGSDRDQSPAQELTWTEMIPLVGLLSEHLSETKNPVVIVMDQTEPWPNRVHDLMREYDLGSLLLVPIPRRDQIVGMIELAAKERGYFTDQDLTLAQSVGTAVGQALETAQLHQSLQQHAANLEEMVAQRTRELQTERDRTQAILEALGEAVVVADLAGTIQYTNPAVKALTGFNCEEMSGQNWRMWHSDQQPADFYARIEETIRAGQTWRGEVIFRRKDDSCYDAALTVAPLFDLDRRHPTGFVSVQRDVTPLKEAERSKNKFVSNVSHELRTPLSVITLVSDNLHGLYERLDEAKRRAMIQVIQKHTQALNELIGDVLEISRIDSERISLKRERLNLVQLAQEEVDKLEPLAQEKGQTLSMPGLDRAYIWGHEGQLRQTIRNLLNNAIKYTPNEGQIRCEGQVLSLTSLASLEAVDPEWPGLAELPAGGWAALRVVDTGVGISRDDLPYIFERFYRVNAQQNIRGTGLGLAIARELIEIHQGQIAVTSTPGQGSIFAIYLPLLQSGEE